MRNDLLGNPCAHFVRESGLAMSSSSFGSEIPAGKSLTLDEERERDRETVKWFYALDALRDCFKRIDAETGISARELLGVIFEENGYPEFYAEERAEKDALLGIDLVNN